jgi:hypothetical protein
LHDSSGVIHHRFCIKQVIGTWQRSSAHMNLQQKMCFDLWSFQKLNK